MGAYDNMFNHASTFKVELDEWYTRYLVFDQLSDKRFIVAKYCVRLHQDLW